MWTTFQQVYWAYERPNSLLAGVGFVLTPKDPYEGIYLDDCRDPATGTIQPDALTIIRRLNSYAEISPSGRGVKILVRGNSPAGKGRRKAGIELYGHTKFFAITGHRLPDVPPTIEDRLEALVELYAELFDGEPDVKPAPPTRYLWDDPCWTDEQIIDLATRANGEKFERLMEGDWEGRYPSQSEADLALLGILAFWTRGDPCRMRSLFNRSGLAERTKWRNRPDYQKMTVQQAIDGMLTRGIRSNQSIQPNQSNQSTQEELGINTRACRPGHKEQGPTSVKNTTTEKTKQGEPLLLDLVEELTKSPAWKASFVIARRLRRLGADQPEPFEEEVADFCERSGHDFEELFSAVVLAWEKVKLPEGEEVLTWALGMARQNPLSLPGCTPRMKMHTLVGSMAGYLASHTRPKPFYLPVKRLAALLGTNVMKVSRMIDVLEKYGVLKCVKEHEYTQAKAKEYEYFGPPPGVPPGGAQPG